MSPKSGQALSNFISSVDGRALLSLLQVMLEVASSAQGSSFLEHLLEVYRLALRYLAVLVNIGVQVFSYTGVFKLALRYTGVQFYRGKQTNPWDPSWVYRRTD